MTGKTKRIGVYEIGETLGRDGFKRACRARNTAAAANGLPEWVALCLPHVQNTKSRTMLEKECAIVQSLDHPGLVRFFGVEETDGLLYVVTELVEGETLSDVLKRRGPLPLSEAVGIVRQTAEALDYVHASLRFHRDIKPENLMLESVSADAPPRVRLLNFGLARLMAHSQVGSASYMAPEQFSGAAGMKADVWALGVTFFQMISNALPFVALDEASLMHNILYEAPALDALEGGAMDRRLVGVMRRVLEKDPDKRYAKAGDFASDLEAVLVHAGAVSPFEGEIEVLLRAHFPLLFIESHEEERVIASLERIREAMAAGQETELFVWSETRGLCDRQKRVVQQSVGNPIAALQGVIQTRGAGIFVFLDMHRHFTPVSVRLIRDAIWTVKRQRKSLVFVSPLTTLPPELEADATLVSYPPPEMERLRQVIEAVHVEAAGNDVSALDGALRETLARAVVGLTEREAERVLRRASVAHDGLGPECVIEVVRQKQQAVRKSGVLEFVETDVSFDDVGGLANLKTWFRSRRQAFSPEGLRFGLRPPRGAVLVGVPGCGKSLSAKALAADWQTPLLRLDMGRLRGSLLGESERRLRTALQTAEAAAPCVLWIDELEKAFSGLSNTQDSGVSQRMFGLFLNWLSERRAPVFVVATANNVRQLPAEFTRKGRFDEVFFVGLPDELERRAIWDIHLKRPREIASDVDLASLIRISQGYSGAEIAEAVVTAMFQAFSDNARPVNQADLETALREGIPLSQSHAAMIADMLAWGQANAFDAS